jgi:hypothetical protein
MIYFQIYKPNNKMSEGKSCKVNIPLDCGFGINNLFVLVLFVAALLPSSVCIFTAVLHRGMLWPLALFLLLFFNLWSLFCFDNEKTQR